MNLIVDQGNSRYKLAIFDRSELVTLYQPPDPFGLEDLKQWLSGQPVVHECIISSVGDPDPEIQEFLQQQYGAIVLTKDLKLPFTMGYESPQTLGVDRIALMSAANLHHPTTNVLVIDAGSCITFDFLDASGTYHGGTIAPGIRMRYLAMHRQTAGLPLLEPELPDSYIGVTTAQSMHVGVLLGMAYEIDATIDRYREDFGDLTVILTGGDAHFLRDSIKNDIFAHSNFLLEGLNHLLEVNSSTF